MRRFDAGRIPPEPLFILGSTSQFVGQALAIKLFDDLTPGGVALLRVFGAALMIVALRRSWRRRWTAAELRWASIFGIVLAAMNLSIYYSVELVPLGNAVSIEFLGPVAVAAFGTRTPRSAAALLLAVAGVVVLAGVETGGTLRGIWFALLAGSFWAGYIVLGHRVARGAAWVDGLGVGMFVGALVISPFGIPHVPTAVTQPALLRLRVVAPRPPRRAALERHPLRHRPVGHAADRPAPLRPPTGAGAGDGGGSRLRRRDRPPPPRHHARGSRRRRGRRCWWTQAPSAREMVGIGLVVVAIVLSRTAERTAPATG